MARAVDERPEPRQDDDHQEDEVPDHRGGREEVQPSLGRRIVLLDLPRRAVDDYRGELREPDDNDPEGHQPELDAVVRNAPGATRRVAHRLRGADSGEKLGEPDEPTCEEAEPREDGESPDRHRAGERVVSVTTSVIV